MFSNKFRKTGVVTFSFVLVSVVLFCASLRDRVEAVDRIDTPSMLVAKDSLLIFHYRLEVLGVLDGFFTECSGMGSESQVVEQRVVDEMGNDITRKIPGALSWSDITCSRGITSNLDVWTWRELVEAGNIADARKNGSLILFDSRGLEVANWNFTNGWPSKVVAIASNGTLVEKITIAHEGITRVN